MDDPTLDETPAARAARWLTPTSAELAGLLVLVLGAMVASGVWYLQAVQRPSGPVDEAAVAGTPFTTDRTQDAATADAAPTRPAPARPAPTRPAPTRPVPTQPAPTGPTATEAAAAVTVHLTGAIATPGVVLLEEGGRVADAVAAAGGLTRDAVVERINLARRLVDGEHVHVPRHGEEVVASGEAGMDQVAAKDVATSAGTTPDGRLDLNRASPAELETLPGIGPSRAEAIVAHRAEHGPFTVPGDLRSVTGIGEAIFQGLAEFVTTG